VPKRSNLFQDVVAVVFGHMAGKATVEESAMLRNRETGATREVDVVIRSRVAAHDVVVSVEASSRSRPADLEWVEQMLKKHSKLPTNALVLVSESGFTPEARREAEAGGAAAIAPEDLTSEDPRGMVVNRLSRLWPKKISLTPTGARVFVERPTTDGRKEPAWFRARDDHLTFFDDGDELGPTIGVVEAVIKANMTRIADQVGLADVKGNVTSGFVLQIGPPWTVRDGQGAERRLAVRFHEVDPPEFHPVTAIEVTGTAVIEANEPIELEHRKLGEVTYAYGTGEVGSVPALVVITGDESQGKMTIRTRQPSETAI
jgi:hypothetical protein